MPGWFGFGSAVAEFVTSDNQAPLALLRRMNTEWSFFRTVLSNLDMVLATSLARSIAHRFAYIAPTGRAANDCAVGAAVPLAWRGGVWFNGRMVVIRLVGTDEDCPEMVVVPAGSFMMGSPTTEEGRFDREDERKVALRSPLPPASLL